MPPLRPTRSRQGVAVPDDIICTDTETTGLDFWHGARPFFVSTCLLNGDQYNFEWDVDPLTRKVRIPPTDLEHIRELLKDRPVVGHNVAFDVRALEFAGLGLDWRWDLTHDTQWIGHMLASHMEHDLTKMVAQYCDINIWPFEAALEDATKQARNWATRNRPDWRIARKGEEDLPSAKGQGVWRMDYWLPRAVVMDDDKMRDEHPDWLTVCSEYGSVDTSSCLLLFRRLMQFVHKGL